MRQPSSRGSRAAGARVLAACALLTVIASACTTDPATPPVSSLRCGEVTRQCMATPGATQQSCNDETDACNANLSERRVRGKARQEGFDAYKKGQQAKKPVRAGQ